MKLLVISSAFPPFRAPESTHTQVLCEELAARGIDLDLVTTRRPIDQSYVTSYKVHPVMPDWDWKHLPLLLSTIRRIRPDVILLIYIDWIYYLHPMITFLPALTRRFFPRVGFVTQFENESGLADSASSRSRSHRVLKSVTSALCRPRTLNATYGALLRDSDRIITLSEHHLAAFGREQEGLRDKSAVIPPPPLLHAAKGDRKQLRAEGRSTLLAGRDDDSLLLVYLGYVYTGKGVDTLLRSYARVRTQLGEAKVKLAIVGEVHERVRDELRRLENELGLSGGVTWTGFMEDDEQASKFLYAADLAVLPFDSGVRLNNSSFAVCAEHGLPIVTTSLDQLEALFKDGENCIVARPKDPPALARAILYVLSSSDLREKIANGAKELARSVFARAVIVDATVRTLSDASRKSPLPHTSISRELAN